MTKEGGAGEEAALLEAEFDVLIRRAGLVIPEERRAELLAVFTDLRGQIARLGEDLEIADEPAAIYRPRVPEKGR